MNKVKFMVVSGFLGAGKTTTMIALAEHINKYSKASIITNDLGAKNLVDASFTASAGCSTTEIAGGCICYQTETLVDKLRRLRDKENAKIIMSDIPGCGVGALDHVYHKLNEEYGDEFNLAPFIVIADPERLRMIMPENADINLPEEMKYLFNAQLVEADAIVLNKIDTLSNNELNDFIKFFNITYPGIPVFAISALKKQNIESLAEFIMSNTASLKKVEIGYGGEDFVAAESKLCWYNRRLYFKTQDGSKICYNSVIEDLYEEVRSLLILNSRNVPHLKMMVHGDNDDFSKSSLIGVDYVVEYSSKLTKKSIDARIIINARAACESTLLSHIMDEAIERISEKYDLACQVFFTECFGMMDVGQQ